MKQYRKNMSGDAAFNSFIPVSLLSVNPELTPELQQIVKEAHHALD